MPPLTANADIKAMLAECTQGHKSVTERVIFWNSQRYEQVFNYELAEKLLLEETEELYEAATPVDKLDAIGDILFVAIGVFWKLGLTYEQIFDIFYVYDLRKIGLVEAQGWSNEIMNHGMDAVSPYAAGSFPGLNLALFSTFVTALGALKGMGMQDAFYDVLYAICDSNDTKEVKGKTSAAVKANINKGAGFVPPTVKLFEIYGRYTFGKTEGVA